MSGELQSGLPKVVVSTLKRPAECLESDETPESKKHHSAEESGSQLVSHANGGDPEQTSSSGNFHPRLVEALSQVPYSPLFGILWPIIIEQASFETRDILREVNPYFEALCHPYRRSDRAKSSYVSYYGNRESRDGLPFVLDLSFDAEWRCWGADKCGFNSTEAFRAFCALGDIDPDQGRNWDPYASTFHRIFVPRADMMRSIWISRTKDIIFETEHHPLSPKGGGYCHSLGLTGNANKAIAMYNFMHDNYADSYPEDFDNSEDEPVVTTRWEAMEWGREYC